MLDPKLIRQDPERVRTGLYNKGYDPVLVDQFLLLDAERRELLSKVELLKAEHNSISKTIGKLKTWKR